MYNSYKILNLNYQLGEVVDVKYLYKHEKLLSLPVEVPMYITYHNIKSSNFENSY